VAIAPGGVLVDDRLCGRMDGDVLDRASPTTQILRPSCKAFRYSAPALIAPREIEWPCRMPVRFDPANKKAIPNISRNCGKSAGPVSGMRPRRGVPKNRDV